MLRPLQSCGQLLTLVAPGRGATRLRELIQNAPPRRLVSRRRLQVQRRLASRFRLQVQRCLESRLRLRMLRRLESRLR